MIKSNLKMLVVIFLMLLLFPPRIRAGDQNSILILNSYNPNYKWTKGLEEGILGKLKQQEALIYQEYMGTKKLADDLHFKNLYNLYQHKYKKSDLDLIIVTDNHAFDFMLHNRNRLFGKIPVVFTGVNNFTKDLLRGYRNYYGVDEDINIETTMELALELQPAKKNVVAFFSNSVTGDKFQSIFKEIIANYEVETSIYRIDTVEGVIDKLELIPENSIIFLGLILNDEQGNLLSVEKAVGKISSATNDPIYSFWEFYLGSGIVGGNLLSAYVKGKVTAELSLDVLAGQVEDKTIITGQFSRYGFDYQELNRLGIKENNLPTNSKIINRPKSFYYQYHKRIWIVIIVFSILFILVIILALYIKKYKKAISKLDDIFSETNLVFWSWDVKKKKIVDISESCSIVYGYSQSEFYSNSDLLRKVVQQRDYNLIIAKQQELKNNPELNSISFEYRINRKNGEQRWVKEYNILINNLNNEIIRMDGIVIDITERKEVEKELIDYANFDPLTGIYNRRRGLDVLEKDKQRAISHKMELTVCFADINDLKYVNDNYGHDAGDELIKTVVEVIKSKVRERDTLIRLGGDEFLICFPDCNQQKAKTILRRIIDQFESINHTNQFSYQIILSYGLAQFNEIDKKVNTIEKIINLADQRMYKHKKKLKEEYSINK